MIPLTNENLIGVVWTDTQFVSVGEYGTILTSPDGDIWTIRQSKVAASTTKKACFSTPATSFAYTNGIYVVTALSGIIFRSTDLDIWTYAEIKNLNNTAPTEACLTVAAYNGVFVAGGKDSSHESLGVMGLLTSSEDGSTWYTQGAYGQVLKIRYDILYTGAGQWIAIGPDQHRTTASTASKGKVWTKQGYTNAGVYRSVAWTGLRYIYSSECTDMIWKDNRLIGLTPTGIGTSHDGGVWDIRKSTSQGVFKYDPNTLISKYGSIVDNGSCIIVVGGNGSIFKSVDNGDTWNITGANGRTPIVVLNTINSNDILYNGVIASGSITSDGQYTVTDKGFVVSLTSNPTINDIKFSNGGSSAPFSIDGNMNLIPLTTYHIRAYAINELGTRYSNDYSFTTKTKVPDVIISSLTQPGNTYVTVNAVVTSSGGVVVSEKGIVYSKVTPTPTILDSTIVMCGDGIGPYMTNIEGLLLDSTYYIRAYATNAIGIKYSDASEFRTLSTNIGTPMRSNRVHVYEKVLGQNVVKITLIGYMKDHTHAPMDILENVQWTIEHPEICKIENSQVVPLSDGTTKITASITLDDSTVVSADGIVIVGNYRLDRISISDIFLSVAVGTIIDIIPK